MRVFDMKAAFLYGTFKEQIFMELLERLHKNEEQVSI